MKSDIQRENLFSSYEVGWRRTPDHCVLLKGRLTVSSRTLNVEEKQERYGSVEERAGRHEVAAHKIIVRNTESIVGKLQLHLCARDCC